MKKIIILGGGLSGLAAGEILSKYFNIDIFEKEPFIGGLASTFEYEGENIPKYYHHIIKSNKTTLKYIKKFGKIQNFEWKKIKIAIGLNKKLSIINSPLKFFKFSYLNLFEKFRFGLFGIYSLFMNPDKIPDYLDAEEWLNKKVGKSVTKKMFSNLYARNKFNIPLKEISAKQFANRISEKEISDYFSYPKQGIQKMIKGLEKNIIQNKGTIRKNSDIKEINLKEKYIIEDGKKISYDILISTIPFPEFIKYAKGISKDLKEKISKIRCCPAVGLCFGTKNFLYDKVYWINLFKEDIHMIMQHSVLCDKYKDKINWCLKYGGSEQDLNKSDKQIKNKYLSVVKKYFPKAKIRWAKVFKTNYAEPIYDINYHKYVPNYKSEVDRLYFAGIQLTYPKIRNMNVALKSGEKVANLVLKDIKKIP
jgi:protoporphyrinogen oxidase